MEWRPDVDANMGKEWVPLERLTLSLTGDCGLVYLTKQPRAGESAEIALINMQWICSLAFQATKESQRKHRYWCLCGLTGKSLQLSGPLFIVQALWSRDILAMYLYVRWDLEVLL